MVILGIDPGIAIVGYGIIGYKNNKFYKSIEKVNVGAFSFLPSKTKLVEEFLYNLLEKIGG